MKAANVLSLVLFVVSPAQCSDILAATMPQGKSHAGSMVPLLAELARQGHNVTIYMEQYGEAINIGSGIKQWYINITNHPSPSAVDASFKKAIWYRDFDPRALVMPFYYSSISCGYVVTEHTDEFLRISKYPWDLVLTDSLFTACGYGLAQLIRANHVIVHTTSVEGAQGLAKGYAKQYVTTPPFFMKTESFHYEVGKFLDRLYLTYEWFSVWFVIAVVANFYMQQSLAPVVPQFDFMSYNRLSSMSFTDMPSQLYHQESRTNELFLYGAYCTRFGNLTGEIADFVSDPNSRGTILLAFGTLLDWKEAPTERREAFAKALNQLQDYRIIWACRNCPKMKTGEHIRISSWAPQQELLNHPRTKLFITHGGLKSLKEAACSKMPTLFMPIFGEQVRNAWLGYHHGFGQIINKFNVTSDYLLSLIQEMLTNPSYKQRAEKLRGYFEDAPIPPLQEGAFKIKRLIKYGGRMPEYFYTRSTNFSYIRYLNLDLFLLIPTVIYILFLIK